jgi:hypothetical protein
MEAEESRWNRIRRWMGLLLVGLVLAFAGWALSSIYRYEPLAESECKRLYAAARTLADTAAVDQTRPIVARVQATAAVGCGALRHAGRVR